MSELDGQAWLVTGASAGFGRSVCAEVLARGGAVVATARNPNALQGLMDLAPDRVLGLRLDLEDVSGFGALLTEAVARFGQIDVLVNNAGRGFAGGVEESSDAEIRALFEVNFFALAAVTRATLPVMRAQGGGCIVNISSTAGQKGLPAAGYYSASKWAVEGLSEALALEAAPLGIRTLIVEPGPFRTDFSGRSMVESARRIEAYEVVSNARTMMAKFDGVQPGDPARAAKLIVDAVQDPNAPLRLLLGRMAYDGVSQTLEQRIADIRRSRDLAPTADFPSGEQRP